MSGPFKHFLPPNQTLTGLAGPRLIDLTQELQQNSPFVLTLMLSPCAVVCFAAPLSYSRFSFLLFFNKYWSVERNTVAAIWSFLANCLRNQCISVVSSTSCNIQFTQGAVVKQHEGAKQTNKKKTFPQFLTPNVQKGFSEPNSHMTAVWSPEFEYWELIQWQHVCWFNPFKSSTKYILTSVRC